MAVNSGADDINHCWMRRSELREQFKVSMKIMLNFPKLNWFKLSVKSLVFLLYLTCGVTAIVDQYKWENFQLADNRYTDSTRIINEKVEYVFKWTKL